MDYRDILTSIQQEVHPLLSAGRVADYIPALANVPADKFGMAVQSLDGPAVFVGDASERFSIQSIAKVFSLTMALGFEGDNLWKRVGREPSGNPFNSLVQLEYENGKPRNPFINAGALVLADVLLTHVGDAKESILEFVRAVSGNDGIEFDLAVAESERAWGDRNAALAHFLKSFGNLTNSVDAVLDVHVHLSSLAMSCTELAEALQYLANGGADPRTGQVLMTPSQTKRTNALMLTCGVYDAAGDFAYRVGLPAKSGVGGGIAAVMPGQWTVVVWSPGLNEHGNSLAGTRALELFTTRTGISIF